MCVCVYAHSEVNTHQVIRKDPQVVMKSWISPEHLKCFPESVFINNLIGYFYFNGCDTKVQNVYISGVVLDPRSFSTVSPVCT